jgi:hypothetical protein
MKPALLLRFTPSTDVHVGDMIRNNLITNRFVPNPNSLYLTVDWSWPQVLSCNKQVFSARFSWKLSVKVVFIFSSKTSVLVWYSLKQAENDPNTTHVSDLRLSLCENDRFQKLAYSACFQAEYNLYINLGTVSSSSQHLNQFSTLI